MSRKRCPAGTRKYGDRCMVKFGSHRELQIEVPEGYAKDGDFDIKSINGKNYRVIVRLEVRDD